MKCLSDRTMAFSWRKRTCPPFRVSSMVRRHNFRRIAAFWIRRSRFGPKRGPSVHELGLAFVVFAAIQMAVMAGDYAWHYLSEYAPLLISIAGVVGTVGATVAVKRYLLAPERLGKFRVRHDSCPSCGRNLVHSGDHCVECGRPLKELCTRCGETISCL